MAVYLPFSGGFIPVVSHQERLHRSAFPSPHLNLSVIEVVRGYAPYMDFCTRNPTECYMEGPEVLAFDAAVEEVLLLVKRK